MNQEACILLIIYYVKASKGKMLKEKLEGVLKRS